GSGGDANRPGRAHVGELLQELAFSVEHLDAVVLAVAHIDAVLRVDRDGVRGVEVAWLRPALAPSRYPIAVFIHLRDARVVVAVADVAIAGGVPDDIGGTVERVAPRGRHGRVGRTRRFNGLRLAPDRHDHATFGVELDHHIRAFVDAPDVVVLIDADDVRKDEAVEILADLANELPLGIELEQLRPRRAGEHE